MQTVKKLMDLPISGSGCLWARFAYRDTDATLEFRYTDRGTVHFSVGTLFFNYVITVRFWDEPHTPSYWYSESYESVAEVCNSEWVAELERTEPKSSYNKLWRRRHFAILLSSCGFFELIADDCEFSARRANEEE